MYAIIYIILLVISIALSYLTRPKPPDPPGPSTDIRVPQSDPTQRIAWLFGTRDRNAPMIVWYGDLFADPIKKGGGKK